MGFLAEMLAVATVWLSSFALCQFGVALENHVCPHAKAPHARTVARSRGMLVRSAPIATNATPKAPTTAPREA